MTYAFTAYEFAADTHILKLQRLQNKVLRTKGNLRGTPVGDQRVAFTVPCVYDSITE
jgi:hypothetical protein